MILPHGEDERRYMDYLFVYDNGWYLKIDDEEKLIDYHKKTGNRYEGAIMLYKELRGKAKNGQSVMEVVMEKPLEERIKLMSNRDFQYMHAAIIQAEKIEGTFLDGIRCLIMEMGMNELKDIRENGACYINHVGGKTFNLNYTQFCRRKELVFPDFKIEDIRVKQFSGGKHWYAFVGDMQVRDGDILKWDTEDEAYHKALEIVEGVV